MFQFNSLLVPVDFSHAAESAYAQSLALANGERPVVILLHVIDPALARFIAEQGLASHDDALQRMRGNATKKLDHLAQKAPEGVTVESLVCEGIPFVEIVRKADDFKVHVIVMGKHGSRTRTEELLFGSTAERVIRGANRPVIVIPSDTQ